MRQGGLRHRFPAGSQDSGPGKVGRRLVGHLHEEGASLAVTDLDRDRAARVAEEYGAEPLDPEEIYDARCDIFSPCALGGVLNRETVPRLKCRVVAGAANNQLATEADGEELHRRGVLYAPDYVINSGGLIQVVGELEGMDREAVYRRASGVYQAIERIIAISRERGIPTYRAADIMAEERLRAVGAVGRMYLP